MLASVCSLSNPATSSHCRALTAATACVCVCFTQEYDEGVTLAEQVRRCLTRRERAVCRHQTAVLLRRCGWYMASTAPHQGWRLARAQGGPVVSFFFVATGSVVMNRRMKIDGRTKRLEKRYACPSA